MFSFAVLAGTVITTIPRGGSLHATVSIINIYKEGNLAIQQAGKNMSAKVLVVCKQCPLLRRGEQEENSRLSSGELKGREGERRASPSKSWIFPCRGWSREVKSWLMYCPLLMEKEGLWRQAELGSNLSSCNLWKKTG